MTFRTIALCSLLATGARAQTITGVDQGSGIAYALLSVEGKVIGGATSAVPPRLTAQCTKDAGGKLKFELLADAGDAGEMRFVPPFRSTKEVPDPAPAQHGKVTMEFLGYVKVKPVKRDWIYIREIKGEMRYATPGFGSNNMEDVRFYLRYMRSLPTLRLTLPFVGLELEHKAPVVVEFETANWQAMVKAEPLCGASGL